METSVTEDALDMRVKKAGHDKIPLARIERRSKSGSEETHVSNNGRTLLSFFIIIFDTDQFCTLIDCGAEF